MYLEVHIHVEPNITMAHPKKGILKLQVCEDLNQDVMFCVL